jgi:hypothetical protein
MKEKFLEQVISLISSRFLLALIAFILATYLAMSNKISGSEFVTLVVSIAGLYIAGRSVTGIFATKNNNGVKNGAEKISGNE